MFCLPVYLPVCLLACPAVSLAVFSVWLCVYDTKAHLFELPAEWKYDVIPEVSFIHSLRLSICLPFCLSMCLSVCLPVCLSVYLAVWLFACLSGWWSVLCSPVCSYLFEWFEMMTIMLIPMCSPTACGHTMSDQPTNSFFTYLFLFLGPR